MQLTEKNPQAAFDRALAVHQAGRLNEAEIGYLAVLRDAPRHWQSFSLLGVLNNQRDRFEAALGYADGSIAIEGRVPNAHVVRGVALDGLKRYEEAVEAYRAALALDPGATDALTNSGITLVRLRRYDEALACYELALQQEPGSMPTRFNRGLELLRRQRCAEALAEFDAVRNAAPHDLSVETQRAAALSGLGHDEAALQAAELALAHWTGAAPERLPDCHAQVGVILSRLGQHRRALVHFRQALALPPGPPYIAGEAVLASLRAADWQHLERDIAKLCGAVRHGETTTEPFVAVICCDDAEVIFQAGAGYAADKLGPTPARALAPVGQAQHARIRLGYFSADFYAHATALLITELIEQHDRTQFEVFLFSFSSVPHDSLTERLAQASDHFFDVRALPDTAICALARELKIDIAVDLKGYTEGARAGIFAGRAAPVQVNYLGYPGSMGAGFMDYIIGDASVTPPEHARWYAEKIVSLPDSYQPNGVTLRPINASALDRGAARLAAGLPAQGFVFCCFNNSYKVLPAMFDIWMRLLHAVDGSALWLSAPVDSAAAAALRRHAAERGIAPERLVFAAKLSLPEHLARHALADLFLDTLPFNAHTTGSDALWAGLPMLTLIGNTFAGRVGASLLRAAGLPELVTTSPQAYEARALALARASDGELRRARDHLSSTQMKLPLFDVGRYRLGIEAAYRRMWETEQRGAPPAAISITA